MFFLCNFYPKSQWYQRPWITGHFEKFLLLRARTILEQILVIKEHKNRHKMKSINLWWDKCKISTFWDFNTPVDEFSLQKRSWDWFSVYIISEDLLEYEKKYFLDIRVQSFFFSVRLDFFSILQSINEEILPSYFQINHITQKIHPWEKIKNAYFDI